MDNIKKWTEKTIGILDQKISDINKKYTDIHEMNASDQIRIDTFKEIRRAIKDIIKKEE